MTILESINSIENENKADQAMVTWLNTQITDLSDLKANGFITGVGYAKLTAKMTGKRNQLARLIGDRNITLFTLKLKLLEEGGAL